MSKRKYLLSISDALSKKELGSVTLTKPWMIAIAVAFVALIIAATYLLTSRTPIRYTVPGYPTEESRAKAAETMMRADSLERVIRLWGFQMANIRRILEGESPIAIDSLEKVSQETAHSDKTLALYASADSALRREMVERRKQGTLQEGSTLSIVEGMHFFAPVKGVVKSPFSAEAGHRYTEISITEGNMVHAVLEGTVIASYWDELSGNSIIIQHPGNVISVYRNNEKILKRTGERVTAGTAIAITGNTGSSTPAASIVFELWVEGESVDAEKYIKF